MLLELDGVRSLTPCGFKILNYLLLGKTLSLCLRSACSSPSFFFVRTIIVEASQKLPDIY